MPYIREAIGLIRAELPEDIPLIGFGGAPFTLASYAIEGQGSKNYVHVKQLMYGDSGCLACADGEDHGCRDRLSQ